MEFEDIYKWSITILVSISGVYLYYKSQDRNAKRRNPAAPGLSCKRCLQNFDVQHLGKAWKFPATPLKILGWDSESELDALFCEKCRKIVNGFLVISIVITMPITVALLYAAAVLLGILTE